MYDSLAMPDEDDEKKSKNKTRSPRAESKKVAAAPISPKQQREPAINLLKSNIESKSSKKRSGPASPGKSAKTELEAALSNVNRLKLLDEKKK